MTIFHNYIAVIGRMCGDDEDTCLLFECVTREGAINAFTEHMRLLDNMTAEELELAEANGEGVFINHVLASVSPIEEV